MKIFAALWLGLWGGCALAEDLAQRTEAFYQAWQGAPSAHGGLTRAGVDASGLVYLAAWELFQVRLPRNMAAQIEVGAPVAKADLRPGDLVYFAAPRFVGLYLGAGRFAHVSSKRGVTASPLQGGYWGAKYAGARRLSGLPKLSGGDAGDAVFSGMASHYGASMRGRLTASGERYDPKALTAAHRTLPFGTWLRVANTWNGRQVRVRINDRGPFKPGRVLDLSQAAAAALNALDAGLVPVRVEVLGNRPAEAR